MSNKITGKEYPLLKIFSSDFEYHIPAYQRPYAWTEEETGTLFDDLYDFYRSEDAAKDNYFLGSIVLIKEDLDRYSDVIDGQQRLTTLSILFAVLTDTFSSNELKVSCKGYLQEAGNPLAGIKAQPRLFLRERDQAFFNKYIQNVRLNELDAIDPASLDTEAQVHIQKNCHVLKERFKDVFSSEEELLSFSYFLLNRCFLVAVYTPNQESAFRVFSVMNSRGLDLLPTDIIKSETIGKLSVEDQAEYTSIWEEMENTTGRDGFNEVFTHTRTIFAKEKAKKNLLDEFREFVLKVVPPKDLINNLLVPYSDAYVQLKNCEYASTKNADEINNALYWLNKTGNNDWMPPAIKFFAEHSNESDYILWFVNKLERLASFLLATAQDVNHRMDRYKWILVEMESHPDSSFDHPLKNIELTDWEKKQFAAALDGEIYTMTPQRRNYIIQRLDSFVSDGGATYNAKLFTIEHVLPQNPKADSDWLEKWPNVSEQKYWLNRIANLVPLTRQRNSSAQNYDFDTKKTKYFQTKNGTSSFTLTTQVLNVSEWTPEVVRERQEDLEQVFSKKWDLETSMLSSIEAPLFMLAGRGGNAYGELLENEGFRIKKGSRIAENTTDGLQQTYADLRQELINEGTVVGNEFQRDCDFTNVSVAAAVVLGRSSNGRKEWSLLDGRTIADVGGRL